MKWPEKIIRTTKDNIIIAFTLVLLVFSSLSHAFNSQEQYENYVTNAAGMQYLGDLNSCVDLHKFVNVFQLNDLYNVVMPATIDQGDEISETDRRLINAEIVGPVVARAALYTTALVVPGMQVFLAGAIAVETIVQLDTCTNLYVIQPYEYANMKMGGSDYLQPTKTNGYWKNTAPCAATAYDIPYYFQCDDDKAPGYNSVICDPYVCDNPSAPVYVSRHCTGQTYVANCSCSAGNKPDPYCYRSAFAGKVGSIVVGYDGGLIRRISNNRARFSPDEKYSVNPGSGAQGRSTWTNVRGGIPIFLTSYYTLNQNSGAIQGCVIAPLTFLPTLIGCSTIAPPLEQPVVITQLTGFCSYLMAPRSDLQELGNEIMKGTFGGQAINNTIPISRFLKSEMHFTSIMVGCVKDMLVKIFMTNAASGQSSFLEVVQHNLRGFILAVLSLYVSLVGIKIMLSEGELKRSDYIMFLVKFGMVLALNTSSFWYQPDPNGGPGSGIFPALIYGSDELSSMFVGALAANDPLQLCSYPYNGAELLTDRVVTLQNAGVSTAGYNGVKLSVWDMLDCKMINYLNLGSCHYDGMGMLISVLISVGFVFGLNIMFAVVLLIFAYFTVSMTFKFARISILASIAISTLVLMSPIFACFMLFDKTMPIFQAWIKSLIGHMLYPAFLMAYFCLVIMTLDSVYYGDINISAATAQVASQGRSVSRSQIFMEACKGSRSVFCNTVAKMQDPCTNDVSNISDLYTEKTSVWGITVKTIQASVVSKYLLSMVNVMLFAMLFYFLMDATIAFIATLVSAEGLEAVAGSGILSVVMGKFVSAIKDMMLPKKGGGG